MEEDWKRAKGPFAVILAPPALWLLIFFVVPLAIVWAYSFGQNVGPTTSEISGTFRQDRKSVGMGKSVSLRVDFGGRRIIKTKETQPTVIRNRLNTSKSIM